MERVSKKLRFLEMQKELKKEIWKRPNSLKIFNWLVEISGLEPLTSALQGQRSTNWAISPKNKEMVGYAGFEPATSPLSGVRSDQLS